MKKTCFVSFAKIINFWNIFSGVRPKLDQSNFVKKKRNENYRDITSLIFFKIHFFCEEMCSLSKKKSGDSEFFFFYKNLVVQIAGKEIKKKKKSVFCQMGGVTLLTKNCKCNFLFVELCDVYFTKNQSSL